MEESVSKTQNDIVVPKVSPEETFFIDNAKSAEIDCFLHEQFAYTGNSLPIASSREVFISVIRSQYAALLDELMLYAKDNGLQFRFPNTRGFVVSVLQGETGMENLCKVFTFYFANTMEAVKHIVGLSNITRRYKAPVIFNALLVGPNIFVPVPTDPAELKLYESLSTLVPEKRVKSKLHILNYLKKDYKGDVFKAYFRKSFFKIRTTVVKQGRSNMWSDEYGRDITDRLKWQFIVHKDLEDVVRVPKIYDLFYEGDDSFLVMEEIKGTSLTQYVHTLFSGRPWFDLSDKAKEDLVNLASTIISSIIKIHRLGYVHRDINPANFLITKSGEVCLIDLELAYNVPKQLPSPVFPLGTPGFMSPQQRKVMVPTYAEDVYGLGATIVALFLNMFPSKFNMRNIDYIRSTVARYTLNNRLADAVGDAMNEDPDKRPTIEAFWQVVQGLKTNVNESAIVPINRVSAIELIKDGISAFTFDQSYGNEVSLSYRLPAGLVMHAQNSFQFSLGGVARSIFGVFLTLYLNRSKFMLDEVISFYRERFSIPFLLMPPATELSPGLYFGAAGTALTLKYAVRLDIINKPANYKEYLQDCLTKQPESLGLVKGLAGQGLALLLTRQELDEFFFHQTLKINIDFFSTHQFKSGSWNIEKNRWKDTNSSALVDLADGDLGILLFLIEAYKISPNEALKVSIYRGLNFLSASAKKKGDELFWPFPEYFPSLGNITLAKGLSGLALVYFKAYEVFKDESFKRLAEKAVIAIPRNLIIGDLSLPTGLSGIGYMYAEAFRITGEKEWLERAEWLAELMGNLRFVRNDNVKLWMTYNDELFDPGLFSGYSGVLFFLHALEKAKGNIS